MTNKKQEWLRIGLFVLISYVMLWIPTIILNKKVGFEVWFTSQKYTLLCTIPIFSPAIANILTRLITKEGWKNSYLHLRLKGHMKHYIFALVLPVISGFFSGIFVDIFFGKFDLKEVSDNYSLTLIIGLTFTILGSAVTLAWYTFGEEFGWRAYLYPKLEKLVGTPLACLIGGIIWGLWHAPLTVAGHNFGTEYWGFPWLGVVLMTVSCIADGAILMWITKKVGSVYPASIWHAVNNFGGTALGNILICGVDDTKLNQIYHYFVYTLPNIILGIIFFVLLIKDSKKAKVCSES